MGLLMFIDLKEYEGFVSRRVLLLLVEFLWNDKNELIVFYKKLFNKDVYRLMWLDYLLINKSIILLVVMYVREVI